MATQGIILPRTEGSQKIGEAQERFSQRAKMRREQLEGHFSPFTVINFNPLALRLEGIFKRYCVPSPDDERLPANISRVVMNWHGKDRVGHALTIREPLIYGKLTGAKGMGAPGEVLPEQEVAEYLPIAIVYNFLEHYSPIFVVKKDGMASAPPKDARRMYGVLAFEGDLHTLEPQRLAQNGRTIQVPLARTLTVGKTSQRVYETVTFSLDEYLEQMFTGQKKYCDVIISRAQQKFTEGKAREEIGASERTWYRWAIRMGYAPAPKESNKTWLNELISLTAADDAPPGPTVTLRKCPGCRAVEPEENTPFCVKCNRPMDTFKTFMEGHHVPEGFLMALTGEEREQAMAEYQRRQQGFGATAMAAAAIEQRPQRKTKLASNQAAVQTMTPGDEP